MGQITVLNNTKHPLNIALQQVAPLYWKNNVAPGESAVFEGIGDVWFTVVACIAHPDGSTDYTRTHAVLGNGCAVLAGAAVGAVVLVDLLMVGGLFTLGAVTAAAAGGGGGGAGAGVGVAAAAMAAGGDGGATAVAASTAVKVLGAGAAGGAKTAGIAYAVGVPAAVAGANEAANAMFAGPVKLWGVYARKRPVLSVEMGDDSRYTITKQFKQH